MTNVNIRFCDVLRTFTPKFYHLSAILAGIEFIVLEFADAVVTLHVFSFLSLDRSSKTTYYSSFIGD